MNTDLALSDAIRRRESDILESWLRKQTSAATTRPDLISDEQLRQQSRDFLSAFVEGLQGDGVAEATSPAFDRLRDIVGQISMARARQGFTPGETATFVFSLKEPLFDLIRSSSSDPQRVARDLWTTTTLLDQFGLYTFDMFQKGREEIIARQQTEMLELSTPVVTLWRGVLGLPLIGTLDSERTQIVMENLLQRIVQTGATIAILDITGVPTVDTLVAQHLLKTVAAARLMGADCIISGVRPQIAQTIVHLGVDLNSVTTKATLADAFAIALSRLGLVVTRERSSHQVRREE